MRKRGRFVFGNIQDVIQVNHPQHHLHAYVGGKERSAIEQAGVNLPNEPWHPAPDTSV
jgi:hypothetical protein